MCLYLRYGQIRDVSIFCTHVQHHMFQNVCIKTCTNILKVFTRNIMAPSLLTTIVVCTVLYVCLVPYVLYVQYVAYVVYAHASRLQQLLQYIRIFSLHMINYHVCMYVRVCMYVPLD